MSNLGIGDRLVRQGIAQGNRCAFCGRSHPGYGSTDGWDMVDGKLTRVPVPRIWEGWELGAHTEYQRYLPDLPENLCQCEGRDK